MIAQALGEPAPSVWPTRDLDAELSRLHPGTPVTAPEVLFRKIDEAQIAEWAGRFGGAEG